MADLQETKTPRATDSEGPDDSRVSSPESDPGSLFVSGKKTESRSQSPKSLRTPDTTTAAMAASDKDASDSDVSTSDQQHQCSVCKKSRPVVWFTSLNQSGPLESCMACRGANNIKTKKPDAKDQLADLTKEWVRKNVKVSTTSFTLWFASNKARVKVTEDVLSSVTETIIASLSKYVDNKQKRNKSKQEKPAELPEEERKRKANTEHTPEKGKKSKKNPPSKTQAKARVSVPVSEADDEDEESVESASNRANSEAVTRSSKNQTPALENKQTSTQVLLFPSNAPESASAPLPPDYFEKIGASWGVENVEVDETAVKTEDAAREDEPESPSPTSALTPNKAQSFKTASATPRPTEPNLTNAHSSEKLSTLITAFQDVAQTSTSVTPEPIQDIIGPVRSGLHSRIVKVLRSNLKIAPHDKEWVRPTPAISDDLAGNLNSLVEILHSIPNETIADRFIQGMALGAIGTSASEYLELLQDMAELHGD